MRVVVIGTSGSGKSTMAARIGGHFGLPVIELDAINWLPDWTALSKVDLPEFLHRVDTATVGESWVVAGNYTMARHIVWVRATHLVWLDYPKHTIMCRVIIRSLRRAIRREVIWGGNREDFRAWMDPGHPIRWAWKTWQSNRSLTVNRLSEPASAHLAITQVMRPRDAGKVVARLEATARRASAVSAVLS
jgi:adenylate kinase family enzyme